MTKPKRALCASSRDGGPRPDDGKPTKTGDKIMNMKTTAIAAAVCAAHWAAVFAWGFWGWAGFLAMAACLAWLANWKGVRA